MDFTYVINELLRKDINEVILYPYGEYAKKLEYLLVKKNIKVKYRVDNIKKKTCDLFLDGKELKSIYAGEHIVLSTTSFAIDEILFELLEYVKKENISFLIADYKNYGGPRKVEKEAFLLKNILPCERNELRYKICILETGKIYQGFSGGLYEQFNSDPRFELKILCSDKLYDAGWIKELEQKGYEVYREKEFDFKREKPDVVFLTHWFDKTVWNGLRANTKYVIALPFCLIPYGTIETQIRTEAFWESEYKPDYYIYDSLLFSGIKKYDLRPLEKIVELGNPKYDEIYEKLNQETSGIEFEKFSYRNNCKTVLWAITHGLTEYEGEIYNYGEVSFYRYAKTFFEYAKRHGEMNFILRAHPGIFCEYKSLGLWTDDDEKEFLSYIDKTVNIVFDVSPTYKEAFHVADAIITESECGIMVSALPTGKPICIAYRSEESASDIKDYVNECCYQVKTNTEFEGFLDQIRLGQDPMKERRQKSIKKYIKSFDGKNAERIKDFTHSILEGG